MQPVVTGTQAAFKELQASKKVLELQQKDNYKQHEYIQLLEGEIDRIQSFLELKQNELSALYEEHFIMTNKAKDLEQKLKTAQMQEAVFQKLSDQNKVLLAKYHNERKKRDDVEHTLSDTLKENEQLKDSVAAYTATSVNTEMNLTYRVRDLTNELEDSLETNKIAHETIERLSHQVNILQKRYILLEDIKADETMRSRQIDYQILNKYDEISNEFQKTKDTNEILHEKMLQSSSRNNTLETRLSQVMRESENMEEKLLKIYDYTELSKTQTDSTIRKIVKESTKLKKSLSVANETILD